MTTISKAEKCERCDTSIRSSLEKHLRTKQHKAKLPGYLKDIESISETGIEDYFNEKSMNIAHRYGPNPNKNKDLYYKNFRMVEGKSKYNKRFGVTELDFSIQTNNNLNINNIGQALDEMISVIRERTGIQNGDKIQLTIKNSALYTTYITTGILTVDQHLNPFYELMQQMGNIMTSDESIVLEDCVFIIRTISMPRGGKGNKIINLSDDKKTKKSIIQIKNRDNLCLPRAVVVALSL